MRARQNSLCDVRMPVSMMYAVTPVPLAVYVNVVESGSARWSIRSSPQVAFVLVPNWLCALEELLRYATLAQSEALRRSGVRLADSSR